MGPNYGFTSFDNFLKGILTVFQLLTLEGWIGVFYLVSAYILTGRFLRGGEGIRVQLVRVYLDELSYTYRVNVFCG